MPKISPIHFRKLQKVFEVVGWRHIRTKGDHMIYEKAGFIRPVVIPKYKSIPPFIISNNLRTAGLSHGDYFKLLKSK